MQVLKPGVRYIAEGSKENESYNLEILFCHKDETGKFVDGMVNEELIEVLANRYLYLISKCDSIENIKILQHLKEIKSLQSSRISQKRLRKNKQ